MKNLGEDLGRRRRVGVSKKERGGFREEGGGKLKNLGGRGVGRC